MIDYVLENVKKEKEIVELKNEIEKLKKDISWYSMWHKNFQYVIEKLTTELETYRPTKLDGNGQCSCFNCELKKGFNRHWTCFCYRFKGHIYCNKCYSELFGGDLCEK